jgi:hypothetical protein
MINIDFSRFYLFKLISLPKATAPPFTFTLFGSRPNFLILANTTTLKASFISNREISSFLRPVCLNNYKKFRL